MVCPNCNSDRYLPRNPKTTHLNPNTAHRNKHTVRTSLRENRYVCLRCGMKFSLVYNNPVAGLVDTKIAGAA